MTTVKNAVSSEVVANKKITVFKRDFDLNTSVLVLTHENGLVLNVGQPADSAYIKKILATSIANILTAIHAQACTALETDVQGVFISNAITKAALACLAEGSEPVSVAITISAMAAIATKYRLAALEAYNHASREALENKISNSVSPLSVLESLKTSNPDIRTKIASWAKPTTATAVSKEAVSFDY